MADEVEPASKRRREGEAQQAPMRRQPRPLPGTPDWGSVLSAAQLQPAYLVRSRVALPPVTAACVNSARLALGDPTDGGHLCAYVATGGAVYRHTARGGGGGAASGLLRRRPEPPLRGSRPGAAAGPPRGRAAAGGQGGHRGARPSGGAPAAGFELSLASLAQ